MAKASFPVKLRDSLITAAQSASLNSHRNIAEQIEYWAELGRRVANVLDSETLLSIQLGLATLRAEDISSSPVDPEKVFVVLDQERNSGALSEAVAACAIRYQASIAHPGFLEACYPDGHVEVGQFTNGQFIAERRK